MSEEASPPLLESTMGFDAFAIITSCCIRDDTAGSLVTVHCIVEAT